MLGGGQHGTSGKDESSRKHQGHPCSHMHWAITGTDIPQYSLSNMDASPDFSEVIFVPNGLNTKANKKEMTTGMHE